LSQIGRGFTLCSLKDLRLALALIASRKIPFELLISEQRSLKSLEQVFCEMKARKVIKVAMIP
jgi:L-iditol 2-dehydrogenase